MMEEIKRFIAPDGREYVAFRALNGNIVIALDPHAYQDIVSMPSTIDVSFAVKVYNYTVATLWFTVEGSGGGAPWSWASAVQLGACGSGANIIRHVPSLGTRDKPASATVDATILTFRAYSDDEYTIEVGSGYPIVVSYHWIDSSAMSLLDEDNFDDGTLQDWALVDDYQSFAIDTGYVLSAPNSAMAECFKIQGDLTRTGHIGKTFAVPAASEAYLIVNIKYVGYIQQVQTGLARVWVKELSILKEDTIIQRSGATPRLMTQEYNVTNQQTNWLRMVTPISVDETAEYRIGTELYLYSTTSGKTTRLRVYHDDIKVVYA